MQLLNDKDYLYLLVPHRSDSKGVNEAPSANASALELAVENITITPNVRTVRIPRANGTRMQAVGLNDAYNDTDYSLPEAEFTAPATPELLRMLLAGVCQNNTITIPPLNTGVGTATQVTFAPAEAFGKIADVKAGEGFGFDIVKQSPVDNKDEIVSNAVVRSIKLTCAADANDARLMVTATFVGQGYTNVGNVAYTPISQAMRPVLTLKDLNWLSLTTATGDDESIHDFLNSIEIELSNNATFPAGRPNGLISFPKFEGKVSVSLFGEKGRAVFAGFPQEALDFIDLTLDAITPQTADARLDFSSAITVDSVEPDRSEAEVYNIDASLAGSNTFMPTFKVGPSTP